MRYWPTSARVVFPRRYSTGRFQLTTTSLRSAASSWRRRSRPGSRRFEMIQHLGSYPSMKDSGVPWVGPIPSHWAEKRAKYLYCEIDHRADTGSEELLSVSHLTGVTPRSQK